MITGIIFRILTVLFQESMRRQRRLCAIAIDTMGRELMIRGQWQINEQGYPWVLGRNDIVAGQRISITTRDVVADANTLPIMYSKVGAGMALVCSSFRRVFQVHCSSVYVPGVWCSAVLVYSAGQSSLM